MGNISANKLGGLGLILGPSLATLLFLVIFMALGDAGSSDPTIFGNVPEQSTLESFLGLLPGISLVFFVYGLTILANDIKTDGVNEPLFRLGLMGVFFGVLGIVFAISLGNMLNLDGLTGLPEGYQGTVSIIGGGFQSYTSILFAIGITLIALAMSSNREGVHRIFAYLVALLGVVNIVVTMIQLLDSSSWESTFILTPISYLIFSIWSITLGLHLFKKN